MNDDSKGGTIDKASIEVNPSKGIRPAPTDQCPKCGKIAWKPLDEKHEYCANDGYVRVVDGGFV